jgi:hypothetical protein
MTIRNTAITVSAFPFFTTALFLGLFALLVIRISHDFAELGYWIERLKT